MEGVDASEVEGTIRLLSAPDVSSPALLPTHRVIDAALCSRRSAGERDSSVLLFTHLITVSPS